MAFDGGRLTSDAGILLLAPVERRLGIAGRRAACLEDTRAPERIRHELAEMIRFRPLPIAAGYPPRLVCLGARTELGEFGELPPRKALQVRTHLRPGGLVVVHTSSLFRDFPAPEQVRWRIRMAIPYPHPPAGCQDAHRSTSRPAASHSGGLPNRDLMHILAASLTAGRQLYRSRKD